MADEGTGEAQVTEQPKTGMDAINNAWDQTWKETADPPLVSETPVTPVEVPADEQKTAEKSEEKAPDAELKPEGDSLTTDPAVQIDPSLVLLAEELDVNKEALDELIASDPEQANTLLTQLAEEHLALTSRTLFGTDKTPAGVGDQILNVPSTSEAGDETPKLSPLETLFADEKALAEFTEEHGEVLTSILKSELEDRKAFKQENADLAQLRESLMAQQQQVLIEEMETTFKSFGNAYADFYGSELTNEARSPEQKENRGRVGDMADALRTGDRLRGTAVKSDRYYLAAAHNHVASELRSVAARKSIIEQLQTRAKSITNKPSAGRVANLAAGSPDEKAHNAMDRKAAELGIEHIFPD
jgi:hypothetical protein